ncbi:brevican core protein-like [Pseudoliparis swirei]|uniref:brevican core protein-like n=1 Tax=Pseudoliparis swirei TaxID=2059687 RepID=UPI0024BE7BF8|nr:brevican core protein-like [Pseudoliparis swirei]
MNMKRVPQELRLLNAVRRLHVAEEPETRRDAQLDCREHPEDLEAPRTWRPRGPGGHEDLEAPRTWRPRGPGDHEDLEAPRTWRPRGPGGPEDLETPRTWRPRGPGDHEDLEAPRTWRPRGPGGPEDLETTRTHEDLEAPRTWRPRGPGGHEDLEALRTWRPRGPGGPEDLMGTVPSRAWIGLYHLMGNWRWSLSNPSFFKPGEQDFRSWHRGEPNDAHSGENCVGMTSGLWADYDCNWAGKSLCFDATGPNPFVLIATSMTWTQAHCRAHHTDLAIVRNEQENLMARNTDPSGEFVWIGLHREPWKWSDGSDSSFAYWGPGQPLGFKDSSEACVAADFSADGLWETLDCDAKSAFICYTDVPVSKRVVKVRLEKRDSALDLNDPVVTENLLKKLKQKLEDQGLNDDIKLSWKKQSDGKVFHKEEKETKKKKSCDEL